MKTRAVRRAPRIVRFTVAATMAMAGVVVGLSGSTPAPATTTEAATFGGLACSTGTTSSSSWGSATAPTNAIYADFTITGGGGAGGDSNAGTGGAGGAGGTVSGRIAVTPGQVLWARIGCGGTDSDSFGDYANRRAAGWSRGGPAEDVRGGGGGGSTGLCVGTTAGSCSGGSMVAIAGGGGGGGRGSGTGACSDQSGGAGGNAGGGSDASAHSGTARGGGRGGKGSGSTPRGDGGGGGGGGGQGPTNNSGATTADNTGGTAGSDVNGATNGGSMGGDPPVDPGEGGAGGRGANGRNDITGGGGGGGYTGGGGGAGGEDGSCIGGNWNGAGGGGAGSSWARSTVSSRSFSTVSGTFSTCNDSLGANAGRGANAGSGARGCHGFITVTWVKNAPPTGADAGYTVNKGTATSFTLAANDPDGDTPVTCEILSSPTKGALGGSGCGRSYTASLGTSGTDTITYRVLDSLGRSSPTYTITFTIVNRAPTGAAQTVPVTKGEAKTITLAVTDLDGDPVTCTTSNGPFKAGLGGSGCSRTYTAPANSTGSDSFTYTVSDGIATNSYTITLSIVNRAPTSENHEVFVAPGSVTSIPLPGGDLDGDTTTCSTTAPSGGTLSGGASCTRSYTAPTTLGIYTFTYVRSDGAANSPSATVTIYVQSPDTTITKSHVGVFNSGTQGTYTIGVENVGNAPTAGTITVTDTLPAGMTYASSNVGPSGFTCTPGAGGTTVTCTRTTPLAASGTASFTITVALTEAAPSGTNTATVSATPDHNGTNNTATDPTTVNRRPAAAAVSVETEVDVPVPVTLAGTDPEGAALTYQVGLPTSGSLGGAAPALTFTPAPGSDAEATFTYTVTDPHGHVSFAATVTITVIRPGVGGVVTSDDTGQGIGGITVRLYQDGFGFTPFAATTAVDGSYDLGGAMPEGEYRVIFRDPTQDHVDEWYDDSLLRSASTPITVDLDEELAVDAGLATAAELEVTITNAGSYTVALYNSGPVGASAYRSVPNVSGSTTLRGLPAGTYYVSVTDPAGLLVPEWSGNQTQRGSAVGIPVTSSASGAAPFTLVPRNTIAGTVIDTEGPVPLVTVQAYGATSGAFVRSTKTDAQGEYVLRDLAAGQYKIVFRDSSGAHQQIWNGGAEVMGQAPAVTMANGGAVTADAELTRTATISGTVTGGPEGTTVLAGAKVTLYRNGAAVRTYTTDAEGGYTASSLVAGDYTALFTAPGHRTEYNLDRPRKADADVIPIAPGDDSHLDATLALA